MSSRPLPALLFACSLAVSCGGTSELSSESSVGGCHPFGTWSVEYTLAEGPDAYVSAQPGSDELTITGVDGGPITVTFNGEEADSFSVSEDGCDVLVERDIYWTAGGEPWSDERTLKLKISGDKATGTLEYGCYWNCGGMHGTLNYTAEAVRQVP